MSGKPTPAPIRWALLALIVLIVMGAIAQSMLTRPHKYSQARACSSNLQAIEKAKLIRASQGKKPDGAIPTDSELFGPDRDLKQKPVCPTGGVYTIGKAGEKPKC